MADSGEQLNILVVDDDEEMRRLLSEILRREQHQVIAVESAEAGLELLPVWTFQVAFLDHNLPGMNGIVLGEYLRRSNPDMTLALVTGADDRNLERRSHDLAIEFITKPFRRASILDVLDKCKKAAFDREHKRKQLADTDYCPPLGRFVDVLGASFGLPNVPSRLEERLLVAIRRSMNNLRSVSRYNERDRVVALAGLLTAKVLNVTLPRDEGKSLYDEYDALMRDHGRRCEFTNADDAKKV